MTSAAKKLLEAALALPPAERAELIEALADSLDASESGLSDAWRIEIGRRVDAIERGESHLIPGNEVDARLRGVLDRWSEFGERSDVDPGIADLIGLIEEGDLERHHQGEYEKRDPIA